MLSSIRNERPHVRPFRMRPECVTASVEVGRNMGGMQDHHIVLIAPVPVYPPHRPPDGDRPMVTVRAPILPVWSWTELTNLMAASASSGGRMRGNSVAARNRNASSAKSVSFWKETSTVSRGCRTSGNNLRWSDRNRKEIGLPHIATILGGIHARRFRLDRLQTLDRRNLRIDAGPVGEIILMDRSR